MYLLFLSRSEVRNKETGGGGGGGVAEEASGQEEEEGGQQGEWGQLVKRRLRSSGPGHAQSAALQERQTAGKLA